MNRERKVEYIAKVTEPELNLRGLIFLTSWYMYEPNWKLIVIRVFKDHVVIKYSDYMKVLSWLNINRENYKSDL